MRYDPDRDLATLQERHEERLERAAIRDAQTARWAPQVVRRVTVLCPVCGLDGRAVATIRADGTVDPVIDLQPGCGCADAPHVHRLDYLSDLWRRAMDAAALEHAA